MFFRYLLALLRNEANIMLKLDALTNNVKTISGSVDVLAQKVNDMNATVEAAVAALGGNGGDQAAIDTLAAAVGQANESLGGQILSLAAITQQLKDAVTPPPPA